jgi:hypothetical protein
MNTATGSRPLGQRVATGARRLLVVVVVVALLALVGYLASERNARTYSLELRGDHVLVLKGRMLPVSAAPWEPRDPTLAETYAPIALEGHPVETFLLSERFNDRDDLDRALFGLLEQLARPRLASDDPKALAQGFSYLRRAKRLPAITQEQRAMLARMESELAWYQARLKLEQARQLLGEALGQLEVASTGRNRNAEKASLLAAQISAPTRQFEDALRRALAGVPPAVAPSGPAEDVGQRSAEENPGARGVDAGG